MGLSEENLKRTAFYKEHYQVVVDFPLASPAPYRISDHEKHGERICRFCGKSTPEVSFRKKAHAVSNFLGNKSLFLMNECDACNELFGEYEDHLANWFGPMRTLCQMRRKGGVPKYKSDKLTAQRGNGGMELCVDSDSSLVSIERGGSFRIPGEIKTKPYVPLRAAKALVKSAISVLPRKSMSECENTIAWLLNKAAVRVDRFPVLCAFTPGINPHKDGRAVICRRRNPRAHMPYMWFVVETANFLFQVMVPFCKSDGWITHGKDNNFEVTPFPTPFSEEYEAIFGKTVWYCQDWAYDKHIVQNREASFHVYEVNDDV